MIVNIFARCNKCNEFHAFPDECIEEFICEKCKEVIKIIKSREEEEGIEFEETVKEFIFLMTRCYFGKLDEKLEVDRKKCIS